jgi:hypothetical protein
VGFIGGAGATVLTSASCLTWIASECQLEIFGFQEWLPKKPKSGSNVTLSDHQADVRLMACPLRIFCKTVPWFHSFALGHRVMVRY